MVGAPVLPVRAHPSVQVPAGRHRAPAVNQTSRVRVKILPRFGLPVQLSGNPLD
jgi:hypothetical protein